MSPSVLLPDTHCTPLPLLWGNNKVETSKHFFNAPVAQQKTRSSFSNLFVDGNPVANSNYSNGTNKLSLVVPNFINSPPDSPNSESTEDFNILIQNNSCASSPPPPSLSRSTTANSLFSNSVWSPSFNASSPNGGSNSINMMNQQSVNRPCDISYLQQQQQQQQQSVSVSHSHLPPQQQQQRFYPQPQHQLPVYNDCQFFSMDGAQSGVSHVDIPTRWTSTSPLDLNEYPPTPPYEQQDHHQQQQLMHHHHMQKRSSLSHPQPQQPHQQQQRKKSESLRSVSPPQIQQTAIPSSNSGSNNGTNKLVVNTELYKTELCATFIRYGNCPYGRKCQFAHGQQDLKVVDRPPKWRSKPCQNWIKNGTCAYNERCCFRHDQPVISSPINSNSNSASS